MTEPSPASPLHVALEALAHGQTGPALALLAATTANDAAGRARAAALCAHLTLAGVACGGPAAAPTPDELLRCLAAPIAGPAVAAACAALERAAVLRFDREALRVLLAVHQRASAHVDVDVDVDREALHAAASWLALLAGKPLPPPPEGPRLLQGAQAAALHVELTTQRAIEALAGPDRDAARALVRRAALMAQTEGQAQPQYLAHIVLARLRRMEGRAHLATRILTALAKVVPAPWRGWVDWELVLAGGRPADAPAAPARALVAAIDAAETGDRRAFDTAALTALRETAGFAMLHDEARALVAAIDPDTALTDMPAPLRAFCGGAAAQAPDGLDAAVRGGDSKAAPVFVVAGPGRAARRILRPGRGLAPVADDTAGTEPRAQGRIDATIAALALAGADGLEDAALFRAVYGFPFVPDLHRGALDVLVHRVRERLGHAGTLDRGSERMALGLREALVVADPRCSSTVDDRVLQLLAARGVATAREAAHTLAVPLRTVQTALAELVAAGVLRREGRGPGVEYRVEDTVFSEPTR